MSPRLHKLFDKEANVANDPPESSSSIREVETLLLLNIGALLDSAVEEEMNLPSLGTTDHPALPPPLKDQEEEPAKPPPEATAVEPTLTPSTLATPQVTLDNKAPATFGTVDYQPSTLPALDQPSSHHEDQEEEPVIPTLKETVEEPTLPSLLNHPFSEQPSPHLEDWEEGPEISQPVESPISTLEEKVDEIPKPTTETMDEKSSYSSPVEVLPTLPTPKKSKETIPHSIQIYKPPRKTDAEFDCEAMGDRERSGQMMDKVSMLVSVDRIA
jgi:hypothetical protein